MSYGNFLLCLEYLIIFVTMQLTSQTVGLKCYICGGKDALLPFVESKSIISDFMNDSCREFENFSIPDRKRYEFECPKNFEGCITKITASSLIRTCSEVSIDDCRSTANEVTEYICICKKDLCNHNGAGKLINELGDTLDIDSDDDESETEESGDDFISSTLKTTNWQTTFENDLMENFNESPSINKSVSYNLSSILAIICIMTSAHKYFVNS